MFKYRLQLCLLPGGNSCVRSVAEFYADAEGEMAQSVLKWLQDVSQPYGTKIAIEGDVGYIRL